MSEWKEVTVGEFSPFFYGKGLPKSKRKRGNIPVVSSSGITGCHNAALVQTKGIVIGRKGTVGKITRIKEPFWPIDTAFYIEDEPGKRDLDFTYYLLQTLGLQHMNSDSAVPGLNRDSAHSRRVMIPPLSKQKAIASVLGALDDKIALNQKICQTLEEMAKVLFKSWFVDFEPVHAKMRGETPYGMDTETAALFPNKFVDSELGPIPEGWRVESLNNIATFLNGLALQKYPPTEGAFLPVIKISQLRQGSLQNTDKAALSIPKDYMVDDGDVLFSWSGSLMQVLWAGGKGALNQHLFKVTSNQYPKWFYYLWIDQHMLWFQSIAASKATTMGHIQRKHLEQAKVIVPSCILENKNSLLFSEIFDKFTLLKIEIKTFKDARDYLLPKLMSGEIRVE